MIVVLAHIRTSIMYKCSGFGIFPYSLEIINHNTVFFVSFLVSASDDMLDLLKRVFEANLNITVIHDHAEVTLNKLLEGTLGKSKRKVSIPGSLL